MLRYRIPEAEVNGLGGGGWGVRRKREGGWRGNGDGPVRQKVQQGRKGTVGV